MNAHLWVVDKKDPVNVLKCLGLYCVKIQFNDMNERSYTRKFKLTARLKS